VKKWQDDKRFIAWLIKMQYAYRDGKKIKHYGGGAFGSDGKAIGMVLYMYEAWCAVLEKKK